VQNILSDSSINLIYIVGGENAVSKNMENYVKNTLGKTVTRIAGETRYETADKINNTFFGDYVSNAVIVSGENFPDALSGGAFALYLGAGMGYVPVVPVKDANASSVASWLTSHRASNAIIMGGPAAVSTQTEQTIAKAFK